MSAVAFNLLASSDDLWWLIFAGPLAGSALYSALFLYYRNTDKSHQFEKTTRIEAQPVTGNDVKIDEVHRTQRENINGDNRSDHRERVQRVT
jgi:hypothetical protein